MKNILFVLLCFIAQATTAQIKLEGVVKDTLGKPLELANVIALNKATNTLESYGITNNEGRFRLSLKKNTTYLLKVSYIGLATINDSLTTKEADITKNFAMKADNKLDAVQLTYEMPVTIKGDTIIYNADSFKNGSEKKLGDVLKKLPGVEVDDEGEITVEGKNVTKVMVEGKEFFDGDSKLATKNIPADAVDKVEVLKNSNEVGQLRGLGNDQDNVMINIKLKEGKKNFWFGEITAGLGPDERYIANPRLFYYSPEYSINIITDFNNIGAIPFTRRDYFKFSGGFRNTSRNTGTNFNVASSDIGFLTLQNNRAKSIDSKFGAANFSYSPKKTWDISGFAIYSGSRTELQQNNINNYIDESTPDEITETNTKQKSDLGLFKLSTSYKPNSNNQMDYDFFAKISKQSERQDFFSSLLGDIDENQSQNPYSINQNFNYYYTLNDNNIFAFEAQHLLQDEDPFYNAKLTQSDQFRFTDVLGLNTSQSFLDIAQDKRVKTYKFDARLDYWYVLNQKSNINITAGTTLSTQQFDSEIYQFLDSGSKLPLINPQGDVINDVKYNFSDTYLGVHYKLKSGKFTFTPGITAHAYSTKNVQFGSEFQETFTRFLPDLNVRLQLKNSENINFNYQMQTDFTDVNRLAEGVVFNNYNSLFAGNRTLENALSHNLNLSYFSFNLFNYTNIFAFLNYNKRVDPIRNRSQFLTIPGANPGDPDVLSTNSVSSPFNSNFADETFSANGRFERTFGKLKASIGGNFAVSKFTQEINGNKSVNESFTQSYRTRFSTNFRDAPNIEVGYNLTINEYDQGNNTNRFITNSPFVNVDAYFLKSFIFTADYSYNNYKSEERTINSYSFLKAELSYQKKDSKWEYTVSGTNLLNTKSLNQDNSNDFLTSTSEYFIQPRYVILSLKYNL
ncbi:carboxypeptidase regulatory-like domain-containing protein [Kordia sp. YSTF-M3]|uniref:Carboxypeptidase regulatory-like domain-containing protein n=1 Tax=Kordia aestuariivivens TaxID=2759037 RepID=A0ABR7Q3X7_9FLAO|nr:carboxypeptidase-like regulatory domain-containing protein [Kordia aestuariivivens]MBC8753256.1 carboxypeptidase regulatory-like domain-containing protein [Kordia aestuariivivens]